MPSPLSRASFASIPLCFASCSIGKPTDPLPTRLAHLASAGFSQIELSFPDLQAFATQHLGRHVDEKEWDALCEAGEEVRRLVKEKGLEIFILQPFGKFEGWREGTQEREDAFETLDGWIRIMKAVGTDTLQVGSSDAEGIDTSREAVVKDLRLLCDKLKEADPSFRVIYENWCWSSHASTSQDVWEIVDAVDRDNILVNLDTFQHAGAQWADPTREDGRIEAADREVLFRSSLEQLSRIPAHKIGFLQISDAYKVSPPLKDRTIDSLRPRGRWSHDYRPFPFSGGYLPVVEVTKAVLRSGFRGTFSMEVFDGGENGEGLGEVDLQKWAQDGMLSMQRLLDECAEEE
ncbi:hypothetical protein JCM10207_003428 [Rhodosporidiobolus poonsookiae]